MKVTPSNVVLALAPESTATTSGRVTGVPELLEELELDELELEELELLEELDEFDELEELELLLELDELEDPVGGGLPPPPQPISDVHRIAASGAVKIAGFIRSFFIVSTWQT